MEAPVMMYKTMRDEIAIVAMAIVFADAKMGATYTEISEAAYELADCMLKVRESSSKESPSANFRKE